MDTIAPNITSGRSKPSLGEYNLYGSTGIIGKTATADYSGDMLLVARVGANAGSLQLVNDSCGITDNTLIIKPCKLSSHYLYFYLGQFTRNYTQTVKRAADNKRRYAPGEGSIPPVLLSGVSKGVPPLAHDFACKV
ncbi:hypothetical protein PO170_23270 [Bacteroides ovatus]|uniref:hypothetical protein n=1 Tax=Bacteroides ovatus TaxID=28116 RepID=UPI00110586B3|nr:hypothetical protein [Bacteroides ovatus]MDC2426806.1 hypothetical protein [Bacteroides ovatus]MDC2432002.1 hypothetical protein [Bacteroides ovatus]MDC2476956.1 hypothetical protein [Bacteroides ovatus]MDC2539324.1 hypothetical protein [Bacteroides ovatus]MDC2554543.1 hypothetical protein [Bacteroides ovatus]